MPTRDRRTLVAQAIDSVIAQEHGAWEIIVVNDGGASVADVVAERDAGGRIQLVELPLARGAGAARNIGLSLARGRYVTYLDDDDWYDPDHLARLVAALEAGVAPVVYSDSRCVVEAASDAGYRVLGTKDPYHATDFRREVLLVNNFIPILALMHRRECALEVGGFDERLEVLEDWDLWLRMSERYPFARVPGVTCNVRWREDGSTVTSGRRRDHYTAACAIHARHPASHPALLRARAALRDGLRREHARTPPALSVVIALEAEDDVRAPLAALADEAQGVSFEVVLVVNGGGRPRHGLSGDIRVVTVGGPDRQTERQTTGAALAAGVAAAAGRSLLLMGGDVIPEPSMLRVLAQTARVDGVVAVGPLLIDGDGRVAEAGLERRDDALRPAGVGLLPATIPAGPWAADALSGAVWVDRGIYDRVGGVASELDGALALAQLTWRMSAEGKVVVARRARACLAPAKESEAPERAVA